MEEEAPSRRSVAELAGRFKDSAPPHDAAGHGAEKPVRRRPPRTLQLPKTLGDEQEPPGVTSPLPAKAKRNSALIEKLQANLVLSPTALMPSPKSPGFRLLPPAFPPPSPTLAPVAMVTPSAPTPPSPVATSPLAEEEGPTSFEVPPAVGEGSTLSSDSIKGRARHSIRRRPPSRRNRKSSSGDEVGQVSLSSTGGEGGGGEEVKQEGETDEVTGEAPTPSDKNETREDRRESAESRQEEEEGGDSSSRRREEEQEEEEEEKRSAGGKEGEKTMDASLPPTGDDESAVTNPTH